MIKDLDFSGPDGRFLVSRSYEGTVRNWRLRDGFSKLLQRQVTRMGNISQLGAIGMLLRVWYVRTGQLMEGWTVRCSLHWMVSSSRDGTWKDWDISFLTHPFGFHKASFSM